MLLRKDVKKWLCKACQYPHCGVCGVASDDAVPFGSDEKKEMHKTKKYKRRWICEWCLYPPCGGCGLQRPRATKRKEHQFQLWFCKECWSRSTKETKQERPPCTIAAPALARIHPGPELVLALDRPWPIRPPQVHRLVGPFISAFGIPPLR